MGLFTLWGSVLILVLPKQCKYHTERTQTGVLGLGLSTILSYRIPVMSVGNWYHIVGRYDSTAGTLSVFVNGAKNSVATSGSKNDTDGDFVIGGQAESGECFDGIIDDVANL